MGGLEIDKEGWAKLKKYPHIFESKEMEIGMQKCLLQIERLAKKEVLVDTGRLRASITTSPIERHAGEITGETGTFGKVSTIMGKSGKARGIKAKQNMTGTNVFYGKFVEFGTKFWAGKPFMRPALSETVSKYAAGFIKEAIQRAWLHIVSQGAL